MTPQERDDRTAAILRYLASVRAMRGQMLHEDDRTEYVGPEDVTLRHGRLYVRDGTEPPRKFEREVTTPKRCFTNALTVAAFGDGELTYVEGYAYPAGGVMPCHHAWLVDADGRVYDPTWSSRYDEGVYIGVPFTVDAIAHQATTTGYDSMLTHDFPYAEPIPADWLAPLTGEELPELPEIPEIPDLSSVNA